MAKDRRIGEAGHTSAVNPVLRTGLVAAILAGALAVVGCSTSSACTAGASCAPPPVPRLTYVLTINGQSVSFPKNGTTPIYHVRLGEHLLITVAVIVPRHLTTTALWLGISTDTWGNGPKGRPIGMHPILSHTRHPLPAGMHTFGLRWRVPGRPGPYWPFSFFLVHAWTSRHPPAAVAGPIVELALAPHVNRQLIWGGGLASE